MKFFPKIFSIILTIFLFIPFLSLADGVVVPPPPYYVYSNAQYGVIFYEKDTQKETLILTIDFEGDAKDFGWLIPFPSRPYVTRGSDQIFESLNQLIRKDYTTYHYQPLFSMKEERAVSVPVQVIETKKVAYYEIAVLSASEANALTNWLQKHNFKFPSKYSYLLNDYINQKWYFVAVKISPQALSQGKVSFSGHPIPLKIEFKTSQPFYPLYLTKAQLELLPYLKLSSDLILNKKAIEYLKKIGYVDLIKKTKGPQIFSTIVSDLLAKKPYEKSIVKKYSLIISKEDWENANCSTLESCRSFVAGKFRDYLRSKVYPFEFSSRIPISLYVIADHKKKASNPSFQIEYANWISAQKIKNLAFDINGTPLISPQKSKYFLTYLRGNVDLKEVSEDIYFPDAPNNSRVNAPSPWLPFLAGVLTFFATLIFWFFFSFGLIFAIVSLLRLFIESERFEIVAKIFQYGILSISAFFMLIFSIIGVVLSLKSEEIFAYKGTIPFSVSLAFLFASIIEIGVIFFEQKRKASKRKNLIKPKKSKKIKVV